MQEHILLEFGQLKHGFYLSFGDAVLHNSQQLIQTVQSIPENSFFIETDDSKVDISLIYKAIAQARSISPEQLCMIQNENYLNVF